ncbi:MAG: DUF1592 domain-containing protein [Deltaproteobacteria bacterium]
MSRGLFAVAAAAVVWSWALSLRSAPASASTSAAEFRAATHSLFEQTCSQCHRGSDADGGFDVGRYTSLASLASDRAGWERISSKLHSGEMPPSGIERPQDQIDRLLRFLDAEFARADENAERDPGRVTARRLNRTEYTNTIRDLLGLEFRADRSFPADDSGDGFDNIGEVLTVSPVLMEKYLAAAEQLAERAIATEPLPKPVKVEYSLKLENLRRVDASSVESTHHVDYDAEYEFVVGLTGQRPEGSKAVTLGVWVDGKRIFSTSVETRPSGLIYFDPYSEERFRLALSEGDHTLRLGFIGDAYVQTLPKEKLYDNKTNKWIGALHIVGPFTSKLVKPSRKRILVCDPETGAACVRKILSRLAQRAYRRAVSASEVAALTQFVDLARADGRSAEQGVALALQALLVSPHFLFHLERDRYPSEPSRVHRLSNVELASRLSYFIWSSLPDDELLSAAIEGRLSEPAALDAQVRRMLRDPKASALAENFAGQWLELRNLDSITPDPDKFPAWGPELRDAMKTETQRFFGWMLRNNRPIGEFVDARYTFANELLARYYGIDGVQGPEFRRVALATSERGGILGHASVLSVSSYPTRTSPVIRGKYILQNLLGAPPPPPPPDVPALDEQAVATSASLRQQLELHRSNSVCASCHARMDPLGFGLENYDAIGRWRTVDSGQPVDSSGVLPSGESFSTPAQLRQLLKGMLPDLARCLTEKMLTYALGRGLQSYDKPTVRTITQRLATSGYGLQTLVHEIVRSVPFRSRRAERRALSAAAE